MSIYTRVHNQKKTATLWEELNPILGNGEVIIVETDGKLKLKIGDGVTAYNDLPFTDDDLREELATKLTAVLSPQDAGKVLGVNEQGAVVPVEALKKNLTWGEIKGTTEELTTAYTDTLKLKLPGYDAQVDVQDFNHNFVAVDGMQARVDNLINELTANPDYAPTAEVVDMRTSYDGIIYDTAGQAFRSLGAEVEIIKDNLQTINPNDLGLEQDMATMLVYPTFKGVRSVNGIPLAGGSGGGGGATTIFKLRTLTDTMAFTVSYGNEAKVAYSFSSVDADDGMPTGSGTASYYVNEVLVLNKSIPQGDVEFDVSPYLVKGSNKVRVMVTDADGNLKSLTWDITVVEISIASTFDYTLAYPGQITFKYIAYGDAKKTIHFILDGVPQETKEITSTGKQDTRIFEGLKHGLHTLEVYATAIVNGSNVESNHLNYDVIVIEDDAVTPIVTINHNVKSVLQGELVDIPFIVYDPLATQSNVTLEISYLEDGKYKVDKTEIRTVDRSLQHWTTRSYPLGTVRFTVTLRDTSRSTVVNVDEFKLPIEPVTNDLELHLSAAGRSNNEINPAVWEYNGITTTFDNVNWASSGWMNDANGDTALHLAGGSTATINFKPFDNDIRMYGKTLEFEFAVRDVNNRNANVISCMKDGVGFVITADKALLKSNLNSVECRFGDERKLRVTFVIESKSEKQLMYVYLDGVMTSAFQYDQDNFQQKNPAENIVIGSPYCSIDLYAVRCYSTALSFTEVTENYICDIPNITDKAERYDANDLYDDERNLVYDKVKEKIQVMTITGPLPQVKGDKKEDTRIDYHDPFDEEMCFENRLCTIDVQGTSSQWYNRKNYKLKFKEKFAHIKGEIPVKVFCMKTDYAEATSTHNTGIANLAHTLYSEPIPPQLEDPRCRTTVEGFPCVIFHKETPESEPVFLGKYNFNYDKGSEDVFGFTEDYDVESWEFCKNDTPSRAVVFQGKLPERYNMTNEQGTEVGWVEDFERRYPDHDTIDEGKESDIEAIARFRVMHDWVHSTKDWNLSDKDTLEKYRTEFVEHFNLHYTLVYYVWTFFFLMVDQRAKNMFLTYWGKTQRWYPYLYDNDTCLGINNQGHMAYDFYHEDTDIINGSPVYNGQESVLWIKFREAFAEEIKTCYQELRNSNKLTYDVVHKYFIENQSDKWAECIYNEDSEFKYLSTVINPSLATDTNPNENGNVYQVRGTGEHHLEYFLKGRLNYCDSKWDAKGYKDDYINLRINSPNVTGNIKPCADISITPYSDMYTGVKYGAEGTLQQHRTFRNETHTFVAASENLNNLETGIFGASQISSLGDLAPLYCDYCYLAKASKLIELKIGDADPTYESKLVTLELGANRLLKKLDIRNCKTLASSINLIGCGNIEEVYAEGSSITSVSLADSGYLKVMHLPNTIVDLTIKNQHYITDFQAEGYDALTVLRLENAPNLPISDIMTNAPNLYRVRLINVEWETTETELQKVYDKLIDCEGISETNDNLAKAVVSGIVKVPEISKELLADINREFPELMVSVNGVILCTITYYDWNGKVLHTCTVEQGQDAPDIVADNTIDIPYRESTLDYKYAYYGWSDDLTNIQRSKAFVAMYRTFYGVRFYNDGQLVFNTYVEKGCPVDNPIGDFIAEPTKEQTASHTYTFVGWDNDLAYIEDVTDINAVYEEKLRTYEIKFYNEDELLATQLVDYGTTPIYSGETPAKLNVEYPQDYKFLGWEPALSPVVGETSYTAKFSESDHITDDWATVTANVANGTYKEKYPLGILQRVPLLNGENIEVELIGYDSDVTPDGKTAGLTFLTKKCLYDMHVMNSRDSGRLNDGGWAESEMRSYLNDTVIQYLPVELLRAVVPVMKTTSSGGGTTEPTDMVTTQDMLWLPSLSEMSTEYKAPLITNEGATYEWFSGKDQQERRMKWLGDNIVAQRWWLRTPVAGTRNYFWLIGTDGQTVQIYASYSKQGVAFGFCVGTVKE